MNDVNFDDLAQRFEKNIYESTKGKIRINLVSEDIQQHIPSFKQQPLDILDAGCGSAYFSAAVACPEHCYDLCDISSAMLGQARQRFKTLPHIQAEFHQFPLQQIGVQLDKQYDLVLMHAVIEWLAKPREGLASIVSSVRPGGYLSFLFYNRHSLVYRHLIMGNYRRLNDRDVKGFGGTLTPISPLDPYLVEQWVEEEGLDIVCKTGIRTFFDYQTRDVKQGRSFEDTFEMEHRYARQQPYMYLGRYIHFLCRKR